MAKKKSFLDQLPTPKEIKQHLDEYVIGQENAKKQLAVAVYNHYKRIVLSNTSPDMSVEKSNILLTGPTGSGKTFLVQTIARLLDVPCYIQDCTKITQAGYVGSDIEDCLVGLLRSCNYDVNKAEMGIVVLDEIDKCAKRSAGMSVTRDVSGEGVQQGLLKIVEGDLVGVPPMGGRKHPEQSLIYLNTKNILFIATGAFVGLENIVRKRVDGSIRHVGFDHPESGKKALCDNPLNHVTPEDLCRFGMIPEFIGRFPIFAHTDALTEDDLVRILTEPKTALVKQYQELLKVDNTILRFPPETLRLVARKAREMKTGARGLRGIMESLMIEVMYSAPDNRSAKKPVTIDVGPNGVLNKVA